MLYYLKNDGGFTLTTSTWVSIVPILSLLYYLIPIVFVIWFVTRFFKLQQEKNQILKNISDNLEKLNKNDA